MQIEEEAKSNQNRVVNKKALAAASKKKKKNSKNQEGFFKALDDVVEELEKIEKNTKSVKLQTIEFKAQARKLLPKDDKLFYS